MKKIYLFFVALFACTLVFTSCKTEEFIVTFNPNGGKGVLMTQAFTQKVAQPLMTNTFTNDGLAFFSWNTRADGTGTPYKDEEIVKISGHMVLYAQWTPATGTFTVTFNPNGANAGEMEPQIFEAGVVQALSPNAFYFENYKYTGWNTSPNGKGKSFENEQIVSVTSNMTLYAQWAIITNTYYVIFDANGGEGTMEPQEFIAGVKQKLIANTFMPPDSISFFTGWNTKANGSGYFYQDTAEIRIYENLRLFSQWEMHSEP